MKFLPLLLRNVMRNRQRTLLMAAGIAVAVFVISALLTVEAGFSALTGSAEDTLLNVREKGIACPVTSRVFDHYLTRIKRHPQVRNATGVLRGMYTYRSKDNLVVVSGVDYDSFRELKAIRLLNGSEQTFRARPDSAFVGLPLATQHRWQVGQTVTLEQGGGITFTVAGVFVSADKSYENGILVHKDYLAKLQRDEGKSTYIVVGLKESSFSSAVSKAIDSEFGNFPKPTKTESERASRERELSDFIQIRHMLRLMVLAAIMVSIFGAANGVSMAVRERTREVGILRSLGLGKFHILEIVIGESLLVAFLGGALGLVLALSFLSTDRLVALIVLSLRPTTLVLALVASLLIGLLGAVLPAIRATRLSIIDALRLTD